MRSTYFTSDTKLADILLRDGRLLYVIPHFGVGIGVGEQTIEQVCQRHGIDCVFFLLVCNTYTFDDYKPESGILREVEPESIVSYLINAHDEYKERWFPNILKSIHSMGLGPGRHNDDVLSRFCAQYQREVDEHQEYEEKVIFPYITKQIYNKNNRGFDLKSYHSDHTEIGATLNDLRSIIIKYLPNECTLEKWKDILAALFMFEHDVQRHARLEESVIKLIAHEK